MNNLTDNGWNRCDTKSMDNITDEEVRGLFEMIDRDKSGSLTMRVWIHIYISLNVSHLFLLVYRKLEKRANLLKTGLVLTRWVSKYILNGDRNAESELDSLGGGLAELVRRGQGRGGQLRGVQVQSDGEPNDRVVKTMAKALLVKSKLRACLKKG